MKTTSKILIGLTILQPLLILFFFLILYYLLVQ